MKKTKVAIVTNYPSPYRIPLFEKIAKKVDLCVYFTMFDESEKDWIININWKFKFKILPHYNIRFQGKDVLNYHFNPSIINELRKNDYDTIIVGGYSSLTTKIILLYCKLKNKPFILWSGSTLYEKSFFRNLAKPYIKWVIRNSHAFIAYGSRAEDYIASFNISSEKIFKAINVGNIEFFIKSNEELNGYKERLKKEFMITSNKNLIYVGRLIPIKGVEYLIKAYEKFKRENDDLGLIIVGNGHLKEKLKSEYDHLNNLYFIDFVQPKDLPIFYMMSDVFVLPSTYEIFSIVISEAMASGLPIITTKKVGASADLVQNGFNGYVIPDKNTEELYNSIKKIFQNDKLLDQMGKNSRYLIKDAFNLDNTAEGFLNAINYVVNKKY